MNPETIRSLVRRESGEADRGPVFDTEDVKATRFPEVDMARRVVDQQKRMKDRDKDGRKRASKPRTRHRKRPHAESPYSSPFEGRGGAAGVGGAEAGGGRGGGGGGGGDA